MRSIPYKKEVLVIIGPSTIFAKKYWIINTYSRKKYYFKYLLILFFDKGVDPRFQVIFKNCSENNYTSSHKKQKSNSTNVLVKNLILSTRFLFE